MTYAKLLESVLRSTQQHVQVRRGGLATSARLAVDTLAAGRGVVLVAHNREELGKLRGLISLFTPELSSGTSRVHIPRHERNWALMPPFSLRTANREGWAQRLSALYALTHGRAKAVVLTADNLISRHVPLSFFDGCELRLVRGEELSPEILIDQVVSWGYERNSMVSSPGEIARRGDIVDIHPPGYEKPVRIEFFGDTIEEIRLFDPANQRSVAQLHEILVLPVHPLHQNPEAFARVESRMGRLFQKALITEAEHFDITRAAKRGDFRLMPGVCYDAATVIEEWLPKDAVWITQGKDSVAEAMLEARNLWQHSLEEMGREQDRPLAMPERYVLRDAVSLPSEFHSAVHFEPLVMGIEAAGFDLPERAIHSFSDLFPQPQAADRPWQSLMQGIRQWSGSKQQVLLCFGSDRARSKFLKLAEQDGCLPHLRYDPDVSGVFALVAAVPQGVDLVWAQSLVLGEEVLQPKSEAGRRVPSGAFKGLSRHDDLIPGHILVHRDYGIARFGGLVRMDLGGAANDYLLLQYAGDDKLYVPVDRLSLVQRFKGTEGGDPLLDKLGGSAWQSGKSKARKAIEKIAQDLVEMYAWRKVAKGFRYGPAGELYREFEASFGFEETPDQAKAIQDVLDDMEKPEPMDRLVCGDVGFGKTEVALRAAFRAVSEGRQVALLCPTTVLAEQHFQTFKARLANFAVHVGLLSRFVSRAKQTETLKAAAAGTLDILIGTHRLLSEDVQMPNLGLIVLDEEQRFGVRHKEKLKKFRKNADVLTLTATPIPRTLQLSMSGIRELSIIETAPPERKPVATAMLGRDKKALQGLVERELERGGQVFWVHNRVQSLERAMAFVKELVPTARIGMAHGQMNEKQLEETMHGFWHGELDVLVCTAIVESGLDFPNANTLVVDRADMFGLGQLYQLRGRVGRSDRQAYAVFVVPDAEHLSDTARERLRVILELDYLGAGFQLAMEDLRIRGAGNILGEVQSGHMSRVGLELFLEMLEEEVNKLKNGSSSLFVATELNLGLSANIPESYITDSRERLNWYKQLSMAGDALKRQDLEHEMRDRFGPLPEEVQTFIGILALKDQLSLLQCAKADVRPDKLRLSWDAGQKGVSPESLVALVTQKPGLVRLVPPASLEIRLDSALVPSARLDQARNILHALKQ